VPELRVHERLQLRPGRGIPVANDTLTPLVAPGASSAAAAAVMRGNKKRNTGPEVRLRSLLNDRGIRCRMHRRITAGAVSVVPDFVFARRRLAVFVDGCFWHSCPEHGGIPTVNRTYWTEKLERNARRDHIVNEALQLVGWDVLRLWEHDVTSDAAAEIAAKLTGERTDNRDL
jgi:DNA mismatch endonuclease (patch repair protein)